MAEYYVTVCRTHKEHNEDCMSCRNFDQAAKAYFKAHSESYVVSPSQHPTVTAIKTREWFEKAFPTKP